MNHIVTKEKLEQFRIAFKTLAQSRQVTKDDIILYNLLRGLPINRGFTTITNKTKLTNGAIPDYGFMIARDDARWNLARKFDKVKERYSDTISEEEQKALLDAIQKSYTKTN